MESSVFIDLIVWGDQWGGGGGKKVCGAGCRVHYSFKTVNDLNARFKITPLI